MKANWKPWLVLGFALAMFAFVYYAVIVWGWPKVIWYSTFRR
jgi:hypothetical protein